MCYQEDQSFPSDIIELIANVDQTTSETRKKLHGVSVGYLQAHIYYQWTLLLWTLLLPTLLLILFPLPPPCIATVQLGIKVSEPHSFCTCKYHTHLIFFTRS